MEFARSHSLPADSSAQPTKASRLLGGQLMYSLIPSLYLKWHTRPLLMASHELNSRNSYTSSTWQVCSRIVQNSIFTYPCPETVPTLSLTLCLANLALTEWSMTCGPVETKEPPTGPKPSASSERQTFSVPLHTASNHIRTGVLLLNIFICWRRSPVSSSFLRTNEAPHYELQWWQNSNQCPGIDGACILIIAMNLKRWQWRTGKSRDCVNFSGNYDSFHQL